ncbi:unnamed protein product, partial [Phaeothamnion confervicola]
NFESDKQTVEADLNEDRALMRFELIEALVRVALKKYDGAAATARAAAPPSPNAGAAAAAAAAAAAVSTAGTSPEMLTSESSSAAAAVEMTVGIGAGAAAPFQLPTPAPLPPQSPAGKVQRLLHEHFLSQCPAEARVDPDAFRNGRLYNAACDAVLQEHHRALSVVFKKYSMLNPVGGKAALGLDEWKALLVDCRLLGEAQVDSCWLLLLLFSVSDEIKSRARLTNLSYVEFLEAMSRLADMMHVPTDDDMRTAGADHVLDYEAAVQRSQDPEVAAQMRRRRPSAGFLSSLQSARPLAPKLDRMLRYAVGSLG